MTQTPYTIAKARTKWYVMRRGVRVYGPLDLARARRVCKSYNATTPIRATCKEVLE